jgi:hypothetical protein
MGRGDAFRNVMAAQHATWFTELHYKAVEGGHT